MLRVMLTEHFFDLLRLSHLFRDEKVRSKLDRRCRECEGTAECLIDVVIRLGVFLYSRLRGITFASWTGEGAEMKDEAQEELALRLWLDCNKV